jgi:hypothetical protein
MSTSSLIPSRSVLSLPFPRLRRWSCSWKHHPSGYASDYPPPYTHRTRRRRNHPSRKGFTKLPQRTRLGDKSYRTECLRAIYPYDNVFLFGHGSLCGDFVLLYQGDGIAEKRLKKKRRRKEFRMESHRLRLIRFDEWHPPCSPG